MWVLISSVSLGFNLNLVVLNVYSPTVRKSRGNTLNIGCLMFGKIAFGSLQLPWKYSKGVNLKKAYLSSLAWGNTYQVLKKWKGCLLEAEYNLLSANPKKWSNTLKHFVDFCFIFCYLQKVDFLTAFNYLLTNCLSVFDHFVGLKPKGLRGTELNWSAVGYC